MGSRSNLHLCHWYILPAESIRTMHPIDENEAETPELVRSTAEPILVPNPGRFVLFPIKYPSVWEYYKRHLASFWTADEIDFSQDRKHFGSLSPDERFFISHILAFFAASDGIVNENIAANFICEVQIPEARAFYTVQEMMETVHSETYSLLIDTYIEEKTEKDRLFNAIRNFEAIKLKSEWALSWMNRDRSFGERLVAFACVEVRPPVLTLTRIFLHVLLLIVGHKQKNRAFTSQAHSPVFFG